MSLRCSNCNKPYLQITLSADIDPGYNFDERTIQIIECASCDFKGIGIYEESRRGSLDSESFNHIAYYSPIEKVKLLEKMIKQHRNIDYTFFIQSDDDGHKYKSFFIHYVH
jgi:hypothetical protein